LTSRITQIVDNSSVKILDYAIVNDEPISPSYIKNVAIGALAGAVVAVAFIFLQFILDNKIHSEEYLIENYKYPILAVIPDLTTTSKGKYYYKKSANKKRYYAQAQTVETSETERGE
jgi:capsular polysaccharide biosynthesis protein